MQLQISRKFLRYLFMLFICFNNAQADWAGEVYGGRYYDDQRLGSYLVYSNANPQRLTVIAEVFYEHYTDYDFAGIGGHFLWPVTPSVELGFVVSQAWESYFDGFDEIDYQSNVAGIELEFNSERLTLAAQSGQYFSGYDDTDSMYFSADIYFSGPKHNWYILAATRWISTDSLYFIEAYRASYLMGLPFTAYLGTSVQNLNDSIYAGAYIELFSVPSSAMFLWTEVAELNGETLLTIELGLVFGSGARIPYITAFGSALTE